MKIFFFIFGMILTVSSSVGEAWSASKGARFVYDMELQGQKKPMKMQGLYYVTQGKMRVEMNTSEGPTKKFVSIRHANPEKVVVLYPSSKTYMEIPKNMLGDSKKTRTKTKSAKFSDTGKSKKIAGHRCKVLERKTKGKQEEVCVSADLLKDVAIHKLMAMKETKKKSQASWPAGVKGFPLEYISRDIKNKTTQRVRLREFKRQSVSSKLFSVPKGYKKQTMMSSAEHEKLMQMSKDLRNTKDPQAMQKKMEKYKAIMQKMQKQHYAK